MAGCFHDQGHGRHRDAILSSRKLMSEWVRTMIFSLLPNRNAEPSRTMDSMLELHSSSGCSPLVRQFIGVADQPTAMEQL